MAELSVMQFLALGCRTFGLIRSDYALYWCDLAFVYRLSDHIELLVGR